MKGSREGQQKTNKKNRSVQIETGYSHWIEVVLTLKYKLSVSQPLSNNNLECVREEATQFPQFVVR